VAIYGNDISSYQSTTPTLHSGCAFCFVKVTEGTSYVNPKWVAQRTYVKNKGIVFGAYLFLDAGDYKAQVNHFLNQIKIVKGDLVAIDWENSAVSGATKDAALKYLKSKLPHNRVGLYCNSNFWFTKDTTSYSCDFLWIAVYGRSAGNPGIKASWLIHQYTDKPIDTNYCPKFNTVAQMKTWANMDAAPAPAPAPKPTPTPAPKPAASKNAFGHVLGSTFTTAVTSGGKTVTKTYYVAKAGDTQTSIAAKFKMSLKRLQSLNALKTSHLAVGQELIVARVEKASATPVKTAAKPKVVEQMPKVVASAKSQVGYREGKNNFTKYAADLIKVKIAASWWQNAPWCATFDVWNFYKAGLTKLVPATPGCANAVAWWKSKKRFSAYPAVGALVYYGPGGGSHTGIVYAYDSTYIYTVEGNTNDNGSAEGNGVYYKKRLRKSSYVYGYGYPAYSEGIKSADPKWAGNYKGSAK
jgi:hypothetical protein